MARKKKLNTKLNMAKWVVALRSGRYKQTTTALKQDGGYCCLGVGCTISRVGKWELVKREFPDDFENTYVTKNYSSGGVLPLPVQEWLGVARSNPLIEPSTTASAANDRLSYSFAQIADSLEDFYLGGQKAEKIVARAKAAAKRAKVAA